MLTVVTLLQMKPSPRDIEHGARSFWAAYGLSYLRAWIGRVQRYVPNPRIVVMTDAPELVASCGAVPVRLDPVIDAPGCWAKLNLFRPEVSIGTTLYLDLDTVITGDLSELCALTPEPILMLDDGGTPGLPNGSVLLFTAESCRPLWNLYTWYPEHVHRYYVPRGDDLSYASTDGYIARWLGERPFLQDVLPSGYILNNRSEARALDWPRAHLFFGGEAEPMLHVPTHRDYALAR